MTFYSTATICSNHCFFTLTQETTTAVAKPSLARRAWDAVVHSYNGFRLLALDIRVAVRLLRKTLRGDSLTRRERKQFTKTVGDIFRVVPFSVFIIIPFMEVLLPVYLWLFPSALPSTFQSQDSRVSLSLTLLPSLSLLSLPPPPLSSPLSPLPPSLPPSLSLIQYEGKPSW